MTRIRIEGLLAAFPKLVNTSKQHTYVETENVRYVYQPLEGLYLLLVTNRQSNILEDMDTLRLLGKVVPEYVVALDEEGVMDGAFELIFAFDEVISMGHKEHTNVQQVAVNLDMESHEERLHKMIIQSKIDETKDHMKRKAMEIDKVKMEQKMEVASKMQDPRNSRSGRYGGDPYGDGGMGGGGGGGYPGERRPSYSDAPSHGVGGMGGGGGIGGGGRGGASVPTSASAPSRGMKLGKKSASLLESLKTDTGPELVERGPSGAAPMPAGPTESLTVTVEEKVSCFLKKDGGVDGLEVQGTMTLEVHNPDTTLVRIMCGLGPNAGKFQFKTHPNIDKNLFNSEGVLGLKDPNRPFPTNSSLGVLKWRFQSQNEDDVPLLINCWPTQSGAETQVNIEYEATELFDLRQVQIYIPVGTSECPAVNSIEEGDYRFDSRNGCLLWEIPLVDGSNRSGSMEFMVPACDTDAFFPIEASFNSNRIFCPVKLAEVVNMSDGSSVEDREVSMSLFTERYMVE